MVKEDHLQMTMISHKSPRLLCVHHRIDAKSQFGIGDGSEFNHLRCFDGNETTILRGDENSRVHVAWTSPYIQNASR